MKILSLYLLIYFIAVLKYFTAGSSPDDSLPIDVSFMREIWSPDAEIRNLKEFRTLNVLSKVKLFPFDIDMYENFRYSIKTLSK